MGTSRLGDKFDLSGALARQTSDGSFLAAVDGLRFVAIGWVFLFHSAGYTAKKIHGISGPLWEIPRDGTGPLDAVIAVASVGFFGVQLFFTISGFVLALPFARARLGADPCVLSPSLRAYFMRRVTRLEPPYVVNILVCAAWAIFFRGEDLSKVASSAGASLVYLHGTLFPGQGTLNGVAWSLEIEVRFYLVAPALAAVFLIRHTALRRSILIASIVLLCLLQEMNPVHLCYGHSFGDQAHYFLLGFLLADLHLTSWKALSPQSGWDAAGALAWAALPIWLVRCVDSETAQHGPITHLVNCALMFVAYSGTFRGRVLNRVFSIPMVYIVGGMCYTIYLWHYPMIGFLGRVIGTRLRSDSLGLDVLSYTAVFAVASLPAMAALFVLLEKPFMDRNWPRKVLQRLTPAKSPVSR